MAQYARMVLLQIDPNRTLFPLVYVTVQERVDCEGQVYLMYVLPGGKMEEGEDEIDTLIREKREEGQFPYDVWSLMLWDIHQFEVNWRSVKTSVENGIPKFRESEISQNKDLVRVYAELKEVKVNSIKDKDSIDYGFTDLYTLIQNADDSPIYVPDNVLISLTEVWKFYWKEFPREELRDEFYLGTAPMYNR